MFRYDRLFISKKATEHGFIRDTLEKIYRLADILQYINQETILKHKLALKGGTAINLVFFNLPRLSVDIDLDYTVNNSKEEMLEDRKKINEIIKRYMEGNGYKLSVKTREHFSLDALVFDYSNLVNNNDNIIFDINYSLRSHIFPCKEYQIISELFYEYQ